MTINVNGKIETLAAIGENGIECTNDIIGNAGETKFDSNGNLILTADEFAWWSEYINSFNSDMAALNDLYEQHGYDTVSEIISDEFNGINDYDDHHAAYQRAFDRVKAEG